MLSSDSHLRGSVGQAGSILPTNRSRQGAQGTFQVLRGLRARQLPLDVSLC